MRFRPYRRWAALSIVSAAVACGDGNPVDITPGPAATILAIGPVTHSAQVGASIPGALAVRVTDAAGRAVRNVAVALAVTAGNGSTNPRVALTDDKGEITADWTIGTVVGSNQVTVSVIGVDSKVKFEATGTPGPVSVVTLSPLNPRLLVNVDSIKLTVASLDSFGNSTTPAPTLTVRDSSLISVDANGVVHVLRRGAGTYVVATAGGKSDSVLVTVLAPGQSICTAAANPMELAVGQVVTDVSGQGFCVRGTGTTAEYALVPFYNASIPSASIQIDARGQGLSPLPLPQPSLARVPAVRAPQPVLNPDVGFELRLRERERIGSAQRMRSPTAPSPAPSANAAATQVPAIGDIVKYNVNEQEFCDHPDLRTGRVAAVSDKAVVVADTANPPGGFTDDEYRSIAVTFDTLVDPVDRAAFGAPSDIDGNGRVVIFFTRAVNELTTPGSGGVVLGFFYRRDLYSKTGVDNCAGSNFAEMMYILVPDTGGVVNGNKRTKAQVVTAANGTVAHEYQHLINASRRKYVNKLNEVYEERWLDEGLAHMAEELNFWRASGRAAGTNLDASIYNDQKAFAAYATFEANNFSRYRTYLPLTESQAPVGFSSNDDDLPTRGAIWNFLRFVADHQPPGDENAFWFKLANSTTSGLTNLTNALGGSPSSLLRDWAISVFLDDNAVNVASRFAQPSWNFRSALTSGGMPLAFPLVTRMLTDNVSSRVLLVGNGVSFLRFAVADNQEALLTVSSGGQPLPSTVQLAVVRVK